MLIAFISDIHANLPALKAAIAAARSRKAEKIICAGDITGYGPYPNETCLYLEKNGVISIRGNYDRKVLEVIEHGESAVKDLQKKKRALVIWTAKAINKPARRFLTSLAGQIEEEYPPKYRILVVHGSAVSDDDDVYPSITSTGLESKLGGVQPDIFVCGHTHVPFVKKINRTLVVNCGSTGQPVDGDPMPSFALLNISREGLHAHIIRFPYEVEETVKALKKTSLPKKLQRDFAEGLKRRFLE